MKPRTVSHEEREDDAACHRRSGCINKGIQTDDIRDDRASVQREARLVDRKHDGSIACLHKGTDGRVRILCGPDVAPILRLPCIRNQSGRKMHYGRYMHGNECYSMPCMQHKKSKLRWIPKQKSISTNHKRTRERGQIGDTLMQANACAYAPDAEEICSHI